MNDAAAFVSSQIGMLPLADADRWNLVLHYLKPIAHLHSDRSVAEIMVNRYDHVLVERSGVIEDCATITFGSEANLQALIKQIGNVLDQPVGSEFPVLHARFPDGTRLCCTMPSVTPDGATLTIRCKRESVLGLDEMVASGALNNEMAKVIKDHVVRASSVVVAGGTSSGKTTILRAAAKHIPPRERVITVEDTKELLLETYIPHVISMEAPRRRSGEGDVISMSSLIETSLRQRPDRVIVGEIRNAQAAASWLEVANTGHDGLMTTIHANNPGDALRRLAELVSRSGVEYSHAFREVGRTVGLLIQAKRHHVWGRRISHLATVDSGEIRMLWEFDFDAGIHVEHGCLS